MKRLCLLLILLIQLFSIAAFSPVSAETPTERFINLAQQDIGKSGATYGFTDEWCAMVVKRWADQAGLGDVVPSQANTAAMARWFNENGNRFALTRRDESGEINCWSYGTWSTNLPTADYFFEPQPGDIVFFETNNNPSDGIDHVGVCVNVSGATVDVVEGNTGSKSNSESIVSKNSYNWRANNSKIWGFARPASSDNMPEPIVTSTPSPEVVLPQPTAKDLYSEVREIPKNNMDAILMMDTSGSMSSVSAHTGKPILSYAKEAALAFVNQAFAYNENYRVGLATFDSNARLLQPMVEKQNVEILRDSISGMRANGQTNIAEGFNCASGILDDDGRSDARQVIVLFTDGIHNCSGDPVYSGQQAMIGQSGKSRDIYTVGLVGALSEEEKEQVRAILDQPYAVRYIEIDEEEQIEGAFYLLGLAASSGDTEERIHTLRVRGAASVEVVNVGTGEILSATQSSEMPFGSVYMTKDNYEAIYVLDEGDYTLRVCGGDVRTIGIVMETMDGRAVAVSKGANLRFNGNAGTRLEAKLSFGDDSFNLNDLSFDPYTYEGPDPFSGEHYKPQYELNVPAGIANLPNGGLVSQRANGYSASVPNEANMPDRVHEQHLEIFNPFFESEGFIVESRTSYNTNYDHFTYFFGGSDMKLYRIAENGGEKERVINKKLVAYWVDETGIYYSDGSTIIRREHGESSGKAIVRQGVASGSNLSRMIRFGEYLYYISAKDRCIYAVPYTGGEPRRITSEAARCLTFAQQGDDVILIYNTYHKQREFEYLRAIDLDGNPIAGLESLNKINSHYFNYAHGYLYYCDKDNGCALYRINLNNPAERTKLASISASRIFLFDDYVVTTDDSKYFCVMRPDGSEFKTIYAPYIQDR